MAVPKKKTSKSRRNMRRAHDALPQKEASQCSNCGVQKVSHHMCPSCGHYRGRQILDIAVAS